MSAVLSHSKQFLIRRFGVWFPLGILYAFLYFGRYNLTVAKNALGDLMTKEDFGVIFGLGAWVYGLSFLVNGPLTERYGGRLAALVSATGAAVVNCAMGIITYTMMTSADPSAFNVRFWFTLLFALNMYFQSFGAVAIVKVNSAWFHVNERGTFSGIFGMMISGGIFLAFTVNGWILDVTKVGDVTKPWLVFFVPAVALIVIVFVELGLLRNKPSDAGYVDFDLGDATSGQEGKASSSWAETFAVARRVLTNPIILIIASVELCTGVLRQSIMHWSPIYFKEVWVLPGTHGLVRGTWSWWLFGVCTLISVPLFRYSFTLIGRSNALRQNTNAAQADAVPWRRFFLLALVIFLIPFSFAGWGGLLMVAGSIGGIIGGWVSHLFFQDRRAPAAVFLYLVVIVSVIGMCFSLGGDSNVVGSVGKGAEQLAVGDKIVMVAGRPTATWDEVRRALAAVPATCVTSGAVWDAKQNTCSTKPKDPRSDLPVSNGEIEIRVMRYEGSVADMVVNRPIMLKDPKSKMRAGDTRVLAAAPKLEKWPWLLGIFIVFVSFGVIGAHGLLSGVAGQDFGGSKGAATATGIIDGFVYLGTGIQGLALGYLTTINWIWWPIFILPFGFIALALLGTIWHAKPEAAGGH